MGTQTLYADNLPEIPSEYLEPYIQRFMMGGLEAISFGLMKPSELKADMKVLDKFTSRFGGIHSRYAVMNETTRICRLSDEELIKLAKEVFN